MDVNYINPFINSSIKVFSTFAGLESTPGAPSVRSKPLPHGDINGFIGLNGHGINGYFIINFDAAFLGQILSSIFDHDQAAQDDIYDIAGELTNMITGSAKAELSKRGYFFDVAVPRISHAAPRIPDSLAQTPIIVVPFETQAGKFFIEASILRIEEDFQQDSLPEVQPPQGFISVDEFAKLTRMDPIKVRRLLKTGFLTGNKISNRQWHIPESELFKIHGFRMPSACSPKPEDQETMNVEEFSKLSGLPPTKIKGFLRSGFLKGRMDDTNTWRIQKDQAAKFSRRN